MNRFTVFLGALALSATAALADPYYVKQTNDGYLNVRSGPGTSYDILRRIYPGDSVNSIEQKGRWFRVQLPGGGTGWVSGNFLQKSSVLQRGAKLRVVQTNDGFLNLRSGPSTGNDILRRLYPNDRVTVLEVRGRWARVRTANGARGWVSGNYLR